MNAAELRDLLIAGISSGKINPSAKVMVEAGYCMERDEAVGIDVLRHDSTPGEIELCDYPYLSLLTPENVKED